MGGLFEGSLVAVEQVTPTNSSVPRKHFVMLRSGMYLLSGTRKEQHGPVQPLDTSVTKQTGYLGFI